MPPHFLAGPGDIQQDRDKKIAGASRLQVWEVQGLAVPLAMPFYDIAAFGWAFCVSPPR